MKPTPSTFRSTHRRRNVSGLGNIDAAVADPQPARKDEHMTSVAISTPVPSARQEDRTIDV
jgi:hypothetical protein